MYKNIKVLVGTKLMLKFWQARGWVNCSHTQFLRRFLHVVFHGFQSY